MEKPLIVIKYGSASVTDDAGMDVFRLGHHAAQVAYLAAKHRLIIVSSGSVAAGRAIWARLNRNEPEPDAQTLAMLGSAEASLAWQRVLREHSLAASQLLVTHREIDDIGKLGSHSSLTKALRANLAHDVIPIINENDAVSESELAKLAYGGDNDGLGAHIAIAMEATTLFLLTEARGVLDRFGKRVKEVECSHRDHNRVKGMAQGGNAKGRGGMVSKIEAAAQAAQQGIDTYIGAAAAEIPSILEGKTGTHFMPQIEAYRVQ